MFHQSLWKGGPGKVGAESRRMPLGGGLPGLTVTYGHPRVILLPAWQAELWPLTFIDKFICVIF